jgi:hypothetical protein
MRSVLVAVLLLAVSARAQNVEIQKELIQRQQAQDAFALQLRQQQELLGAPPGNLRRSQELETRMLGERQRLDNVSAQQRRDVMRDTPGLLRPQERQRADDDRRPYVLPPGGIVQIVPQKDCDQPRPLVSDRAGMPIDSRKPAASCP